jgi:hypothetical protein
MMEEFIANLRNYHILSPSQQKNATRLTEISHKFHKAAKLPFPGTTIESGRTIILESGHQPNFLPHAGTWKKAFLLHRIHTTLKRNGSDAVAFFGFADRNISTARILSKNQVPAMNRDGTIKIGFKIHDADRFKSFCSVNKPTPENWQKEITKIQHHYHDIARKTRSEEVFAHGQWEQVNEVLWKSYELARNFAELNGLIFARVCTGVFGINLCFFLYSDMYHDQLFLEESGEILRNLGIFNQTYNRVIEHNGLDIPPVQPGHLPFWYTCECGMKIELEVNDSFTCAVQCPHCNKEYELRFGDGFSNLSRYYGRMDFTAVSRNSAMAHGLGDTLFLTGTGGSLQYGRISDEISKALNFHRPRTLGWRSRDYYLGMTHHAAVHGMMQQFSLAAADLLSPAINQDIARTFQQVSRNISEAEGAAREKDRRFWTGMKSNAGNQLVCVKNVFSMTPSFLDILASQYAGSIIHAWKKALSEGEIQSLHGVSLMNKDIIYPAHHLSDILPDDLPVLYETIRNIEVQ